MVSYYVCRTCMYIMYLSSTCVLRYNMQECGICGYTNVANGNGLYKSTSNMHILQTNYTKV